MADEILLNNVTQADFDTAEAVIVSLVRAAYPALDLRKGTVIRDVLIRPAASIYALNTDRLADLQQKMSLATLQTDPTATPSDVDAILANFNVTRNKGDKATGSIIVHVDGNRVYNIPSNLLWLTLDGLTYQTVQTYTVRLAPEAGDLTLYPATDAQSYYFILPVTAAATGAQYNVPQGTTMDPASVVFGFVSAEAYSNFSAGVDEETIAQVMTRLPAAVSYKALESSTAIDAKLREEFDSSNVLIQATSVQGYGDLAQLRDKHNPMGFAVGSRVDVYTRTFASPTILTLTKTGTLIAPNTYQFEISRTEAPGYYVLRSISELDSSLTVSASGLPVAGSYAYLDVREADGLTDTFHDIDPANGMIESANSCYQKATITVTGVPESSAQHQFKVEVYVAPGLADIQNFVDTRAVRNVEADYIVRCPFICLVNLEVVAYHSHNVTLDVDKMRQDIFNYINSRSFVSRLTRSELACIMFTNGVSRVDMSPTGMMLQGILRDASGTIHTLQGDSLDLSHVTNGAHMLTQDTVVFAIELASIHITTIGE